MCSHHRGNTVFIAHYLASRFSACHLRLQTFSHCRRVFLSCCPVSFSRCTMRLLPPTVAIYSSLSAITPRTHIADILPSTVYRRLPFTDIYRLPTSYHLVPSTVTVTVHRLPSTVTVTIYCPPFTVHRYCNRLPFTVAVYRYRHRLSFTVYHLPFTGLHLLCTTPHLPPSYH
ncbi:hypothetical protein BDZ97DRAFT_1153390 [Flammula alnicola]|nr:hypothetical protein BDZ97DRAFT_1153390 [Flammula alnicola]